MNYSVLVILIESRNPSHLRLLYTGLHGHCLNYPQEPSLPVEEPIMYMHLPILGMRIKIQHKEELILYNVSIGAAISLQTEKSGSCQCTYQSLSLLVCNVVYKAGTCLIIFVALAQVYPMPLFKLAQHSHLCKCHIFLGKKESNVEYTLELSLGIGIKGV